MAKKKKHEEHENLERWLISYADFITLLFATFVVLYALSQVDIKDFKALEDSIKQAFDAPSITHGSMGILSQQSDSLLDAKEADSMITPLMMEYMSQRYEDQSFDQIKESIEEKTKVGELEGVEAIKTDKGLIIRFSDDYLFKSGSAELTNSAKVKLDKVGAIIGKKFFLHYMRVEGHTDNQKISSGIFPSNWELSSARACSIIRYFINRFNFISSLFTAIGYADTRPLVSNSTPGNKLKNRRVEILILRNKFMSLENPQDIITKMDKKAQEEMQNQRIETINKIESLSEAARNLSKGNKNAEQNAIILNQVYEKELHRISKETSVLDRPVQSKITGQGQWLKPPARRVGRNSDKSVNLNDDVYKEFKTVGR